jgi:hypothetical protein
MVCVADNGTLTGHSTRRHRKWQHEARQMYNHRRFVRQQMLLNYAMKSKLITFIAAIGIAILSGCGYDPGPLAGTWKMNGIVPMTIQFRRGEVETMGIIEKVSYRVEGHDVIVTYQEGLAKGTSLRYTVAGQNALRTVLGTFQRVD